MSSAVPAPTRTLHVDTSSSATQNELHIYREQGPSRPEEHQIGKHSIRKGLKNGEIPKEFREELRLIDEQDPFAQKVQDIVTQVAKAIMATKSWQENQGLLKREQRTVTFSKITTVVSEVPGENAFYARGSDPVLIGFHKELLRNATPERLIITIAHELIHALWREKLPPHGNSKLQEGSCYAVPLGILHDLGIDPTPHKKEFMAWLRQQQPHDAKLLNEHNKEGTSEKTSIPMIIDDHPLPPTIESILDTKLAILTGDRGALAAAQPSEETSRLLSLCTDLQRNVPAEPLYYSPLDSFKQGPPTYDSLSAEDKLRALSTYIRTLDLPFPVRIEELRKELKELRWKIDPANNELLDGCANNLLSRITESPQRWGPVYRSLTQTVKQETLTIPLGRLKLLGEGIKNVTVACASPDRLSDSCTKFLDLVQNEPLAHSDEGRAFLQQISWSSFAWPDKYDRGKRKAAQWQPLVDLAREGVTHALDTAILLGLAQDYRIVKLIPETPRYRAYLCESAPPRPNRIAQTVRTEEEPLRNAGICKPPGDPGGEERLTQLRFRKPNEGRPYPYFEQSKGPKEYRKNLLEALRVVRAGLLAKIAANPQDCTSEVKQVVNLGRWNQALISDQQQDQQLYEFDREIFTRAPDRFLEIFGVDLSIPAAARRIEAWFRGEFPLSDGAFSEQDAEAVRRILGVYRGEENPFRPGLLPHLNLFPDAIAQISRPASLMPPQLYREMLESPTLLSLQERTVLIGHLFTVWNLTGRDDARFTIFNGRQFLPSPGASAEWLDLSKSGEAFPTCPALQRHDTWAAFFAVTDEDIERAAAELVKLGVPAKLERRGRDERPALNYVQCVRDLNWLALSKELPETVPDIARALAHLEGHCDGPYPDQLEPFLKKLYADLPQFTTDAEINELLVVAESLGRFKGSSPLTRQQIASLHTELFKRSNGESSQLRERIAVAAFGLGAVEDPSLRGRFLDVWVSSVVDQLGDPPADPDRVLAHVRNLREKGGSATMSLALNALAERIAASPELCRKLEALQPSLDDTSHSTVWLGGMLTELGLAELREDDLLRKEVYDYLRHPKERQRAEALLWALLERDDECILAGTLLGESEGELEKLLDELKLCGRDPQKLPKYHHELFRRSTNQILSLHDNFRAAPLEAQAVILSDLLIGDRSKGLPVDLMDKVIDDTFADTDPHAATTRAWVKALIRNLEPFEQPLYVAALVATNSQGKVKSDLAESIVEIADMLSALAKKGVQCAAGDPRTSPEFRKPFRTVTHQVKEVPRWEYLKWLQEIEPELLLSFKEFEARKGRPVPADLCIAHYGRRLGSGSVSANVAVTLSDGTALSVSLIRPYTIERTHRDRDLFAGAIDTMLAQGEAPATVNFYRSLLDSAAKRMKLEVNGNITDTQGHLLEQAEHGRVVVIGEKRVPIHSAKVRAQGERFYACDVAPGTVLTELLTADDEADVSDPVAQQRRAELYDYSLAIVTNELTNILDGCFCPDRQPGNILIDSSGVHHIDPKGIQVAQWKKEGYEQLIDVLLGATFSALEERSTASSLQSQADRFMESFIEEIDKLSKAGKELEPLVTEVQKALTALLPLFSRLEPNDLPRVLASALVNQQGEAFTSALVSIARRELEDPQTQLGMKLHEALQGTRYGGFAKTVLQFLPDAAFLTNLQTKLQEWLREKAQFEVMRIERKGDQGAD